MNNFSPFHLYILYTQSKLPLQKTFCAKMSESHLLTEKPSWLLLLLNMAEKSVGAILTL